jgi:integrase/recombinase XerC
MEIGEVETNPALLIKTPKVERELPKTIDFDDLKKMMTINSSQYKELRSVLMIELLYSCALRVSELVGINLEDIDMNEGFVKVMGKGNKARFSPMGQTTIDVLKRYIKQRPTCNSDALFINQKNTRISTRTVQNVVKKRALQVGVSINVHPHLLRHAAATHFLQSSHDLRTVQEFLGHKSIKSTQVYTHLDFLELSKVYDEFHPRAKK